MTNRLTLLAGTALSIACSDATSPNLSRAMLEIVAGDGQVDTVARLLPNPIVARVRDSITQQPLRGVLVNWVVAQGGGSVFAGAALTNDSGIARERWTLGRTAGSQALEARALDPETGDPIVFARVTATALPGRPRTLTVALGGDTLKTGQPVPLSIQPADTFGNVIDPAALGVSIAARRGRIQGTTFVPDSIGMGRVTASYPSLQAADSAWIDGRMSYNGQGNVFAVAYTDGSSVTVVDTLGRLGLGPLAHDGQRRLAERSHMESGSSPVDSTEFWTISTGGIRTKLVTLAGGWSGLSWAAADTALLVAHVVDDSGNPVRLYLLSLTTLDTTFIVNGRGGAIRPQGDSVAVEWLSGTMPGRVTLIDLATRTGGRVLGDSLAGQFRWDGSGNCLAGDWLGGRYYAVGFLSRVPGACAGATPIDSLWDWTLSFDGAVLVGRAADTGALVIYDVPSGRLIRRKAFVGARYELF